LSDFYKFENLCWQYEQKRQKNLKKTKKQQKYNQKKIRRGAFLWFNLLTFLV